jgi:hypothetical protein
MPLFGKKKKDPEFDSSTPDGPGQRTRPTPGEYSAEGDEQGMPYNSLGTVPAQGNRAGGGTFLDNGARVGYLRNLEFSAGGRSQLLGTNTASPNRPHISERTGQVQVSTAQEGDMTAGKVGQTPATAGSNPSAGGPPAQPEMTTTAGENLDTSQGAGPDRRVDKRGV